MRGRKERNEVERQKFMEKLLTVDQKKLVYVDEAGFDNCTGLWLWL